LKQAVDLCRAERTFTDRRKRKFKSDKWQYDLHSQFS
jgi:hypothetical protein